MKKIVFISLVALVATIVGCSAISGLSNFTKCNFDMKNVADVSVAGVNLSNISSYKDVKATDVLKLVAAYTTKSMPLTFNVNVNVSNPNAAQARLDGLDYILWIDDIKMSTGSIAKQIIVGAGQSTVMPMGFSIDLFDVLKSESRDKLLSFGCGLATSNPDVSRVKVSLKPYIGTFKFPTYVTIGGNKLMPSSN